MRQPKSGKAQGKLSKQSKEPRQLESVIPAVPAHSSLPTIRTSYTTYSDAAELPLHIQERSSPSTTSFNNPFGEQAASDHSISNEHLGASCVGSTLRFSNPFNGHQISTEPSFTGVDDPSRFPEETPHFQNPFVDSGLGLASPDNVVGMLDEDLGEVRIPFTEPESFSTPIGSPTQQFTNPFRGEPRPSPSPTLHAANHTHIDLSREESTASAHLGIDWEQYPSIVERSTSNESGDSNYSVGLGSSRQQLGGRDDQDLKARRPSKESSATSTPNLSKFDLHHVALHTPVASPAPQLKRMPSTQPGAAVATTVVDPARGNLSVIRRNPVCAMFWAGFVLPPLWFYAGWFMEGTSRLTVRYDIEKGVSEHNEKRGDLSTMDATRRDPWVFRCRVAAVIAFLLLLVMLLTGVYFIGRRSVAA